MAEIIIILISTIASTSIAIYSYGEIKQVYKNYIENKKNKQELHQRLENRKLALSKNFQELKNIDLETPLYAKLTKEEKEHFLKTYKKLEEENGELYIFASDLLKHVKLENMRNFIKNAPFLIINHHPTNEAPTSNGVITGGSYMWENREIEVYSNNNNSYLYHELLHAASSDFAYDRVGFSVTLENRKTFGRGLNEGYTELLNQRFFNSQIHAYPHLTILAELIELFYENKEDMITDYFNADIFGLIGELLKSITLEETIDIIVDMDSLLLNNDLNVKEYLKVKQKIHKLLQKSPITQMKKQVISQKEKNLVKNLFSKK